MVVIDAIPDNHEAAVAHLVRSHSEGDTYMRKVFALPDRGDGVVRLLEVTEAVPNTDEVLLVRLGRSRDFPFALEIIQVTPEEWEKISAQPPGLALPDGWSLEDLVQEWPQ
jgi:hypothetical protein